MSRKRCAVIAIGLGVGLIQSSWVLADCSALEPAPMSIEIGQGHQQVQRFPMPIKRLAIGDPQVADVSLLERDSFLLVGKQSGATSLLVWTACSDEPRSSMVNVTSSDVTQLSADASTGAMPAFTASQVQTDIRFVEVSRGKLKSASTSLFGTGSGGFLFGAPGTVDGVSVSPGNISSILPNLPLDNSGFNLVWGGGSSRVIGMLNALENSGFAYTLARPSLVALSGQSASFLAGGEVPVPVPSSGSDSISIEYKEFGIRLTLTPTVLGVNRINLKVAPEVSELDYSNAVQIEGTLVPGLRVRRTDTSITLADGESFVISGLISSSTMAQVSKFPGLGDLPVLGALFRSNNTTREDRELLMIVTPRLVQPLAANAPLPSLPGEVARHYDPSFLQMYFMENGDFSRAGLSK